MKVVIVGAGVAGSYLANLIGKDHTVEIYDGYRQRGCNCAWGSSISLLTPKLRKVGLHLGDYWLCKPDYVVCNGVSLRVHNGIIFHKQRMLRDMVKDQEIVAKYVSFENVRADVVVNATGKPLVPEDVSYTVQWKMVLDGAEEKEFYIWVNLKKVGYGWIAPLDEEGKLFHVGAGSIFGELDAIALTKEMLRGYNFTVKETFCGCKKQLDFGRNLPVFQDNIVSVGEAVGCVHPLTGEGIVPSMRSAEILAESIGKPGFPMNYAFKVEEIIEEYRQAFQALETMKRHKRLGIIKAMRVMSERLKQRTRPDLNWAGKLKILVKFL